MSNIKDVNIIGTIPYNCYEHAGLRPYLAMLNGPSFGLRISYGTSKMVPNEEVPTAFKNFVGVGGRTTVYNFSIFGEEAVSGSFIESLLEAIVECGGTIASVYCKDIEAGEIYDFVIPKPQIKQRYIVSFEIQNPGEGAFQDTWLMEMRRQLDVPMDNAIFNFPRFNKCSIIKQAPPQYVRNSVRVNLY